MDKEVYFNEYCKKCLYKDKPEGEEPCNDCLSQPSNTDSHKPTRFTLGEEDAKNERA